ncbi:MAG: tetratricopeptide repeat protein [Patescibacteria group bacterium]
MIYEYVAIGIIVVSIGTIVAIAWRKFPILAAINTEVLQKHRQEQVKRNLMGDRLRRKFRVGKLREVLQSDGEQPRVPLFRRLYGNLRSLEQRYREALEKQQPVNREVAVKRRTVILAAAKELLQQEQYRDAEAKYIEAISLDQRDVEAYEGLADVYVAMRDYEHARQTIQYLLKLNVRDHHAYDHLGRIARSEGKLQEAEKDYLTSISMNGEVSSYHLDLGEVYQAMGEEAKALRSFQEASKLEPNNPRYLSAVIDQATKLGDRPVALDFWERLQKVNPENEKLSEIRTQIDAVGAESPAVPLKK